ncbi:MAG: cytochrome-c peroxidase [Betaproteobacteria bacterium]
MRFRIFTGILLAAAAVAALGSARAQNNPLGFSAAEIQSVLSHGPWPAPWTRDVSNRVSGNANAIALGEFLFFDTGFSPHDTVSCATCHIPEKNWSDGRKLGVALSEVDRNTPSIANARYNRWFGWDGGNDSLWSQSVRPFLDARELAASDKQVAQRVRGNPDLLCRYRKAFNAPPPMDDESLMLDVGKALAAFLETLVTGRSAFDDFRDALAKSNWKAAAAYPESARRGLRIFTGKGSCNLCHVGAAFSHGEFHEINGHLATLRDVVRHYSEIDLTLLHQAHIYAGDVTADAVPVDGMLIPLKLSDQEINDVVAFLESLTERKSGFVRKPAALCK